MPEPQLGLRERKNERTRTAITRAALELSVELGFEQTTIAQIAERADVSPRTVYAWFDSKEDIVVGKNTLPIDRLAVELERKEGDTLDRIQRWITAEATHRPEPEDVARLRHRVLLADPHLRQAQRAREDAAERLIAAAIGEEAGLPPDAVAPRALAAAIITNLLGLGERYASHEADSPTTDFTGVEQMLRAALAALRDRG
jgi:AcrR family transcriptional regulator